MSEKIKSAIILAAGYGKRMQPITLEKPKPLIKIKGKPLIKYSIDLLELMNIDEIIINVHYKSDQIINFINSLGNSKIFISDETSKILDTGGGIKKAMKLIKNSSFFAINSDVLWDESQLDIMKEMSNEFDSSLADSLLCLTPIEYARGYNGSGDFILMENKKIRRYKLKDNNPMVYCGAQIISKQAFDNCNKEVFSINNVWNQSISNDRLMGLKTEREISHLSSPDMMKVFNNE